MWDTNAKIVRNIRSERLPPDKAARWGLRPGDWDEYTEDERRRWREWFDWAVAPGGEFWDTRRGRGVLSGASLKGVDLSGARLVGVVFDRCNLMGANLTLADLSDADLSSSWLEHAVLNRTVLCRANLSNTRMDKADFTGCDLSDARIHATDLSRVNLADAKLFGTRITEPVWNFTLPRATLDGKIIFQAGLPEHPVSDVLGLPPILRRQIADVQTLRDMYRKASPLGRLIIWAWGVSCGFGQSIGRLAFFCVLIFLVFTLLYMNTDFSLTEYLPTGPRPYIAHPTFSQSLYFTMTTFTTPGISGFFPTEAFGRVLSTVQGLGCFLMLGGVLSIFSNKMARLS